MCLGDLPTTVSEALRKGAAASAQFPVTSRMTPLKLALYAALFIGMPVIVCQLWALISTGLCSLEKKRRA